VRYVAVDFENRKSSDRMMQHLLSRVWRGGSIGVAVDFENRKSSDRMMQHLLSRVWRGGSIGREKREELSGV
jgi:hypothetical protein